MKTARVVCCLCGQGPTDGMSGPLYYCERCGPTIEGFETYEQIWERQHLEKVEREAYEEIGRRFSSWWAGYLGATSEREPRNVNLPIDRLYWILGEPFPPDRPLTTNSD